MSITNRKNEETTTNFGAKQKDWESDFQQKMAEKRSILANKKTRMVLGIWGKPKTGKTGLALDFPNRNICVLDWDSGVESTWREHHNLDERIEVYCPIVLGKDIIDIDKSDENSHSFVKYVRGKIENGDNPIFVFDGIDTWLQSCLLKVNPNPRITTRIPAWQYGNRNNLFYHLLNTIFNLDCDVIFITHEADKYEDNVATGRVEPVWKEWGGKLEQEIYCHAKKIKGEIHYIAELVGSRTNGNLVGTRWTVREGNPPNIKWNGIKELREGNI